MQTEKHIVCSMAIIEKCAWCLDTSYPSTAPVTSPRAAVPLGVGQLENVSFDALLKRVESDEDALIRMRLDNYSVPLDKKDAHCLCKSFFASMFAVTCDNAECRGRPRLSCDRHSAEFAGAWGVVRSVMQCVGSDEFLDKVKAEKRSIESVTKTLCDALPDDLRSHKQYRQHIEDWVARELYSFECAECGHVNKSIVVGRMYEYGINLKHCRVCHARPEWVKGRSVVDLDGAINSRCENENKTTRPEDEKQDGWALFPLYDCGSNIWHIVQRYVYHIVSERVIQTRQTFLRSSSELVL